MCTLSPPPSLSLSSRFAPRCSGDGTIRRSALAHWLSGSRLDKPPTLVQLEDGIDRLIMAGWLVEPPGKPAYLTLGAFHNCAREALSPLVYHIYVLWALRCNCCFRCYMPWTSRNRTRKSCCVFHASPVCCLLSAAGPRALVELRGVLPAVLPEENKCPVCKQFVVMGAKSDEAGGELSPGCP